MIGTEVQYDFIGHQGFSPINFIVDPVEWCAIAYTGEDEFGLDSGPGAAVWRVAYSEDPDLPDDTESIIERARRRVGRFIKTGDGKDGKGIFKVTRAEPYILQQRLASEGRKGRVLLAGDALHCNNPIGGLGKLLQANVPLLLGLFQMSARSILTPRFGNRSHNRYLRRFLLRQCNCSSPEAWRTRHSLDYMCSI